MSQDPIEDIEPELPEGYTIEMRGNIEVMVGPVIPMKITYKKDSTEIKPITATAWIIRLPKQHDKLALWADDATIEDVHAFCKARWDKFKIGRVDVGEVTVENVMVIDFKYDGVWDTTYRGDSRMVDQDWEVVLE